MFEIKEKTLSFVICYNMCSPNILFGCVSLALPF